MLTHASPPKHFIPSSILPISKDQQRKKNQAKNTNLTVKQTKIQSQSKHQPGLKFLCFVHILKELSLNSYLKLHFFKLYKKVSNMSYLYIQKSRKDEAKEKIDESQRFDLKIFCQLSG